MITLLDAVSLAGDRTKQNDDACGWSERRLWVIDGATDLYTPPLVPGAASDAAWFAYRANRFLHAEAERIEDPIALIAAAARDSGIAYDSMVASSETWQKPAAALVLAWETVAGIDALDLGDSRLFTLDASGASVAVGGRGESARDETRQVLAITGGDAAAPLSRDEVIASLRETHKGRNTPNGWWVFGIDPRCAAHARRHTIALMRPAYVLLATDGFSALTDRYEAYTSQGLVQAAVTHGLSALALELRAIETADSGGAAHPRWKRSDDATAILARID
jgi:hypothetical protein